MKSTMRLMVVLMVMMGSKAYEPPSLTLSTYEAISSEIDNNQYFIINRNVLTESLKENLDNFSPETLSKQPPPRKQQQHFKSKIILFQCDPDLYLDHCKHDQPIYMLINSFKIQYNGRIANQYTATVADMETDIYEFIIYRIKEIPDRIYSTEELQQEVLDHIEVFCYIDHEGEEVTLKEKVFLALAKKYHFLYFCHMDVNVAKPLHLKQNYLTLIKHDMRKNVDVRSERLGEDDIQFLFETWQNYIIKSFKSDFRVGQQRRSADTITVYCDLSQECEEQLSHVIKIEKLWLKKHPEYNFKIRIQPHRKTGDAKYIDDNNPERFDLPAILYITTRTRKDGESFQLNGQITRQRHYDTIEYIYHTEYFGEDTIQKVIDKFKKKQLIEYYTSSSVRIEPLEQKASRKKRQQTEQL